MDSMLSDIVVVDLTRNLAGPFSTMILGDLGAKVIKVEIPTGGDDARIMGPFVKGQGSYFMSVNRNKKSMTLNIKLKEGKDILWDLISGADILVENFRPGVMERLGFDYKMVNERNPGIIFTSISGFGQYGPYKNKGAYDMVVQGYGGVMSITGTPDGEPVRVGYSIGDMAASLFAVSGILGALHVREKTGKGQHLDIAMLDCQAALLENAIVRYTTTGEIPARLGSRHPVTAPFQAYRVKNGHLILAIGNDVQFKLFCEAVNLGFLAEDSRFAKNKDRVKHIDSLNEILSKLFIQKTQEEWIDLLEQAKIPCGPINSVRDVVESAQIKARDMIVEFNHPVAGKLMLAGCPIKASLSGFFPRHAAPVLGEHTEEILVDLGFTLSDINSLREKGII